MFKLVQPADYSWPVTVSIPVDGGRTEKSTFDAKFKRVSQTRIQELRVAIERSEITDVQLAREVLVGWHGVVDSEGQEIPYSEKYADELLDVPLVASAIVYAFMESLTGAKRKN